jgi:hypothetical protein
MLDQMRQSQVPANVMRTAARGALDVPPKEMVEILVYLAGHAIFGEEAAMTLAGFDEAACIAACSDPEAPPDVLAYFLAPQNRRPALLPALLGNPAVSEEWLVETAGNVRHEAADAMLGSARVLASEAALRALSSNPHLSIAQLDRVGAAIVAAGRQRQASAPAPVAAESAAPAPAPAAESADASSSDASAAVEEISAEAQRFLQEHAAEIAAAESEPFRLVGGSEELVGGSEELAGGNEELAGGEKASAPAQPASGEPPPPAAAPAAPGPEATATGAGLAVLAMKQSAQKAERESVLQKIARLTVGQRVQLAMKGSKDERFVLIRDGNKVVSLAVLESPKVSDAEVEGFAGMKNVQEGVLRAIASKRKFMKNYNVVKALANNPRGPLDVSLTLIKNLLPADLNNLAKNKNVSETLRKLALKSFLEKTGKK